jgi:hypothetical protein
MALGFPLLAGHHRDRLALEVDVGLAADVDATRLTLILPLNGSLTMRSLDPRSGGARTHSRAVAWTLAAGAAARITPTG